VFPAGPVAGTAQPLDRASPGPAIDPGALRTDGEKALRTVGLIMAIIISILLVISVIGLVYGGIGLVISYVLLAVQLAHIRGNGVKVGPDQLPEIHASAQRAASALGLAEMPEVYVIQEGGLLNAFATKWAFRRWVVVYADLIEACGENSRELDMVMAHEMGHLVLNHIRWRWILWPAFFVPFLMQAYSRACEYSADRCGWAACLDKQAAARGLLVLAAGGNLARMASLEAFLRQRDEVRGFWQTVVEWFSTHPWLTRRVEALHRLSPGGGVAGAHVALGR
jgi:Zn-dependent protease with chaperone function